MVVFLGLAVHWGKGATWDGLGLGSRWDFVLGITCSCFSKRVTDRVEVCLNIYMQDSGL